MDVLHHTSGCFIIPVQNDISEVISHTPMFDLGNRFDSVLAVGMTASLYEEGSSVSHQTSLVQTQVMWQLLGKFPVNLTHSPT